MIELNKTIIALIITYQIGYNNGIDKGTKIQTYLDSNNWPTNTGNFISNVIKPRITK